MYHINFGSDDANGGFAVNELQVLPQDRTGYHRRYHEQMVRCLL